MDSELELRKTENKDLYCLSCGHVYRPLQGNSDECPVCHDKLIEKPTREEAKKFSVKVHNDRTQLTEKWNNAMCFLVLGAIGLVIGGLFTVLSLEKKRNQYTGIRFASFEFVVAAIVLAAGAFAFIHGVVRVIKAKKGINRANREIALVSRLYTKEKSAK